MRVVVNNPLFAKEQFLSDAQKPAAASPTTEGEWSGWSSPISVERDRHFFVVSGSENDALGNGPRAAVEVYQFYYGYWRRARPPSSRATRSGPRPSCPTTSCSGTWPSSKNSAPERAPAGVLPRSRLA